MESWANYWQVDEVQLAKPVLNFVKGREVLGKKLIREPYNKLVRTCSSSANPLSNLNLSNK